MPVYTYRCENCGVEFDRQQKFSDEPLKKCPECSKRSLNKVYKPARIVFKGSGFYATDNRSASGAKRAAGNNESPPSEKSSDSPKSETSSDKTESKTTSSKKTSETS